MSNTLKKNDGETEVKDLLWFLLRLVQKQKCMLFLYNVFFLLGDRGSRRVVFVLFEISQLVKLWSRKYIGFVHDPFQYSSLKTLFSLLEYPTDRQSNCCKHNIVRLMNSFKIKNRILLAFKIHWIFFNSFIILFWIIYDEMPKSFSFYGF